MGITRSPLPRSIFPTYTDQEAAVNPATLATDPADGEYSPADDDPDAKREIADMIRRVWTKRFASKYKAKQFVK